MKYIKIKSIILLSIFLVSCNQNIFQSQKNQNLSIISKHYTPKTLLGSNTEFRNWWNVLHYDLNLYPNYKEKKISGDVTIQLEIIQKNNNGIIQIDLQKPMQIKEISVTNNSNSHGLQPELVLNSKDYYRRENAYLVDINSFQEKSNKIQLQIYFEGNPKIAKNAPWDGGWVFTQDEMGRPWMSAAVQGMGASAWFPCKDDWSDEPDQGMKFSIFVPENLVAVANGRLWDSSFVKDEYGNNIYTWQVKNPINTYNIIPSIGYYKNIKDTYKGDYGTLDLNYWMLDYNIEKAKKHFEQVKPMMQIFEDWMGKYPFYEDGYKLVETPYLGMEHQSNVAYGNGYQNGYLGNDRSDTGWGNQFDFIIIHESGHEWFGNNITAKDIADMWIHEAFTTYTEVMYVEGMYGKKAANEYVQGLKNYLLNDKPLIAKYGVRQEGSSDMYNKGANIIHTLRQIINQDKKFKDLIKALNTTFYHQTVSSKQIENFVSSYTGLDLDMFFNQYLRQKNIPVLAIKKQNKNLIYQWQNVIDGFNMPVRLENSNQWIYPTTKWKRYEGKSELKPDSNFLINLKVN